jgi:hypothetical protein
MLPIKFSTLMEIRKIFKDAIDERDKAAEPGSNTRFMLDSVRDKEAFKQAWADVYYFRWHYDYMTGRLELHHE